jgi:hypothetical protein
MQPVNTARAVPEKDREALEAHLDLLLHTFKHVRKAGMMSVMLHVNNLK